VGVLCVATSCQARPKDDAGAPTSAANRDAAREATPPDSDYVPRTAERCGGCHDDIHRQWSASAHATGMEGTLMKAMLRDAGPSASECARCHAPLEVTFGPDVRAAREGVTCEACHLIESVHVDPNGAGFTLDRAGGTEYGPLCDAEDHYFHKMGCAPVFEQADLCGACHRWDRRLENGTTIPVHTSFSEWESGGHREAELTCQSCHMPSDAGKVALGAGDRRAIAHHGTRGPSEREDTNAVSMELEADRTGDRLTLTVQLRNVGVGHAVPSGLPARRLVLEIRRVGADAASAPAAHIALGRSLTDDTGQVVPFYAATGVGRDDRLGVDENREIPLSLDLPAATAIEAQLSWLAYPDEIADRLKIAHADPVPLTSVTLPADATRASSKKPARQAPSGPR